MSFKSALEVLQARVEHFDEVRSRSMKSLPRSKAATFDSVYELLNKVVSLIRSASQLESSLEHDMGYRKVCGNGVLIRTREETAFMKFKPLRVVAYSSTRNAVRISYRDVVIEITGDAITLSFGRLSHSLLYMDPTDLANNAAAYSALLSKVIVVPDELSRTVSSCAKAVGVRL